MPEQETAQIRGGEGGQPRIWPGLRETRPKRGRKIGVAGDRAPSSLVCIKLRGRKIEGAEHATYTAPFFTFCFFFLLTMCIADARRARR